jgi:hypothetical protein
MLPPLEPHQLIATDKDYQVTLPMEMSRAEAKILAALLQRRINDDLAERDFSLRMHEALLSKLIYYITEPIPS